MLNRARDILAMDVWLSIPAYLHKSVERAITSALEEGARLEREKHADRYLSSRFQWAAPGDQQEDAWLVRFCDKDCGEAVFTGPDAERQAWDYWNRYAPSYTRPLRPALSSPKNPQGHEAHG